MSNLKSILLPRRAAFAIFCGILFLMSLGFPIFTVGNNAGSVAKARSYHGFECRPATIVGRYATKGDGFVPSGPPPEPLVPFATVSLMTLNSDGSLTNDVTTSTNGLIASNVNSGTWIINEDCTGTMAINITVPPFQLHFDFVVADKGNEFFSIATTPSAVTVAGKRVQ